MSFSGSSGTHLEKNQTTDCICKFMHIYCSKDFFDATRSMEKKIISKHLVMISEIKRRGRQNLSINK